ncbi:hypothetical protein F5Y17DRAFT_444643 [Xylariaceae sp. FL0594]|nr:hypothetical protein F5Y17DRAFT_444643 [Xylariaceae sp. FL0594]
MMQFWYVSSLPSLFAFVHLSPPAHALKKNALLMRYLPISHLPTEIIRSHHCQTSISDLIISRDETPVLAWLRGTASDNTTTGQLLVLPPAVTTYAHCYHRTW